MDNKIDNFEFSRNVLFRTIEIQENLLRLEGRIRDGCLGENEPVEIFIRLNNQMFPVLRQKEENAYCEDGALAIRRESFLFEYTLDMDQDYTVQILVKVRGNDVLLDNIKFGAHAPFTANHKFAFAMFDKWIVQTDDSSLFINRSNPFRIAKCRYRYFRYLLLLNKPGCWKAIIVRCFVKILSLFMKREVWIVGDRLSDADDNGEVFFKYLKENHPEINAIFVLNKSSKDYPRLKSYGTVVTPYSIRHKLYHLLAKCSVSSQVGVIWRNPFRMQGIFYKDIQCKILFIFLQHGVIATDLSARFAKTRTGVAGFITSTTLERDSIVNNTAYEYYGDEVWLTGMPRFDLLKNSNEKIVTIMPTWRKYLTSTQNRQTGIWELVEGFSDSEYMCYYRNLLTSEVLKKVCEDHGYRLRVKFHPNFAPYIRSHSLDKGFESWEDDVSYREVFSQSSLLVTDYSSTIYDFIYMGKPVIYSQFDKNTFFSGEHTSVTGDFDYERDGFGEVEYDLESTINRIIEYVESECHLKDLYRERIDKLFAFRDQNNCERIYQEIMNLEKRS